MYGDQFGEFVSGYITHSLRKCMETSLENLYLDIGTYKGLKCMSKSDVQLLECQIKGDKRKAGTNSKCRFY